jgi:hypothetical protein
MKYGWLFLVVAPVLAGWAFLAYCPPGQLSWCNCKKVTNGMTLDEVQRLVGWPGEEITQEQLPWCPATVTTGYKNNAVVGGDRFFRWYDQERYVWLIIGMKDGRVFSSCFWEPSL